MFSLESFHKEYETKTSDLAINGRKFQILLPKDLHQFINIDDVMHGFPLWAKIWPAAWVLAGYLAELPVAAEKNFLEIGGGLGVVSIVAASFGHHITMTEYNPDALQFARANALINECPQLNIQELNWNRPRLTCQFDYIIASEVSYREEDIQPLLMLFKNSLKTGGEVILAGEMRRLSKEYYKALETLFDIRVLKKILRSDSEEINIFVFRMRLKREK
ncbi:MAG: 50S ribosomal protein L11 methyltransferase [Desulfobacteraceae bacterium]|jgi:predicted nicotinamide N-methyase|nr:50S ribosomal protein L11 methyltransferase [Desulfobacteraceae bacterium]